MEQFQVEDVQKEQEHHALLKEGDQQQRETEGKAGEYEQQANAVSIILDQIKTGDLSDDLLYTWAFVFATFCPIPI